MSAIHTLQTIFEFAAIIFIVWGFFNEDKFICFEKRLVSFFRRKKLKLIKCKVQNTKLFVQQKSN